MRLYRFVGLVLALVLSGCVIRVYKKEMPRKDIVVEGNQGYLVGSPERQGYTVEKKTRTILVTEVELVNPKKLEVEYTGKQKAEDVEAGEEEPKEEGNYGYIYRSEEGERLEESSAGAGGEGVARTTSEMENLESNPVESSEMESGSQQEPEQKYIMYKVQKGDTLQKISYKFYHKYSLWPKIFEANKDRLEHPDSIYVGQELRIPILEKEELDAQDD